MTSRSFRLETRSRARDDIKRSMQMVEKVRKWEKRWIDLGLSNSLKVYKWVPVREAKEDDEDEDKENQPMELTEQEAQSDRTLPEITPVQGSSQSAMGTQLVVTDQSLPELLMAGSEDAKSTDALKPPESSSSVNASVEAPLALESRERGDASDSVTALWTGDSQDTSSQRDQQPSPSVEATQSVATTSSTSPTLPPALSETAVGLPSAEDSAAQQASVSSDPERPENRLNEESTREQGGPLATAGREPLAAEMGKKEEEGKSDERTGVFDAQNGSVQAERQPQTAADVQQTHDIEMRMERQVVDREERQSRSPTEKMSKSRSRSRSPHT